VVFRLVPGAEESRHLSLGLDDPALRALRADGRAVGRGADPVRVRAYGLPGVRQLALALVQRELALFKRLPRSFHGFPLHFRAGSLLLSLALGSLGHLQRVARVLLALTLLLFPLLVEDGDLVEDLLPCIRLGVFGV